MSFILLGFGLVLIIEGLAYALAPSYLEQLLQALRDLPKDALRNMGLLAAVIGLIFVWAALRLGF